MADEETDETDSRRLNYVTVAARRFMASHPDRRPTYDQQISSDQIVRPRTKSVIPKNKVPNLTNLPHSFKREKFKCIKREDNELNAHLIKYSDIKKEDEDDNGKQIALCAIRGNLQGFQDLFNKDWEKWKYQVEVNLSLRTLHPQNTELGETDDTLGQVFTVTLSLNHLVALVRQNGILQYMLNSEYSLGKWHIPVSVNNPEFQVTEEDSWIRDATCLHLTTKFNTSGLNMILDHINPKEKEALINDTHRNKTISPLHVAASATTKALGTSILLLHGAPVNCTDNRGFTPLFWATRSSSTVNIITLIDHGADVNHMAEHDFLPIDGHVYKKTPLFRARTYDTIKLLLLMGADPTHKASKHEIKNECMPYDLVEMVGPRGPNFSFSSSLSLNCCHSTKTESTDEDNNVTTIGLDNLENLNENEDVTEPQISAIEHLMQFHPDCPTAILDASLSKQDDDVVMDFRVFEGETNEMSVFLAAEKNRRGDLLLHPLMQIFLSLKWDTVKKLFWAKIVFQILLVAILTSIGVKYVDTTNCREYNKDYSGCYSSTYQYNNDFKDGIGTIICHLTETNYSVLFHQSSSIMQINTSDCFSKNITEDTKEKKFLTEMIPSGDECSIDGRAVKSKGNWKIRCEKNRLTVQDNYHNGNTTLGVIYKALGLSITDDWKYDWKNWIAVIFIGLVLLKEIVELTLNGKRGFKIYIKSLQNWIQCLLICWSVVFYHYCETDLDIATHAAAWMVFLAWIDLTLYVGKIDILGEYIYMSVIVSKTIFWCLFIYVPSYMAFTFGFYILLKSNEAFRSYTATFIRILAMQAGELDFKEDFDFHHVEEKGGLNYSVQVMFVFFLICISLIVMNLLLAVTVNKTENLAEKSKKMRAASRIKDVVETIDHKYLAQCCNFFKSLGQPICCKKASQLNTHTSILPKCKKDNNYFVSIRTFKGYKNSILNKIKKFFNQAQHKEIYKFEDGKREKETTGLQISDKLFKGAIKFVMNKHLSDIGFWKNISSLREKSKSQLQALQHHPNVAKKENVEQQTMLSELSQTVSDIKLEQSQTTKELLEELKLLKSLLLETKQNTE